MRLTPNLFWSESQPEQPEHSESQPVVASEANAVPAVVIDEPKTTEVETTEAAPASEPTPVLAPALDTKATEVCSPISLSDCAQSLIPLPVPVP